MRWAEIRGVLAFAATIAAIVFSWRYIESRPIEEVTTATTTTTTTTTTTLVPTTTTTPAQAAAATCGRAAEFVAEAALIPDGSTPGPLARLALSFWSDLEVLAPAEAQIEIGAVVTYYRSYLDTAEPFDFDTVKIILEGDKEKFQQLVTRPAPGLGASREMVTTLCGIEVPNQPSISARSFDDLEDRLLDPPDD